MAYNLKYSYDSSSQSYSVTGWSDIATTDKVIIPDNYDDGTNGEHPVTSIGNSAFDDCRFLTSIEIPDSITSIGIGAFAHCNSLTELHYNATECADLDRNAQAFNYAGINSKNGITVTIGANVKKIPANLFHAPFSSYFDNTPRIKKVFFKNGSVCKSIGDGAFNNCDRLAIIVIPDSVTSIGNGVFLNCNNLKQLIIFPSTPPTLGSEAIPENVQSIYVQQFSKTAYQLATNWASYSDKIVSDNLYLSFIKFNQNNKEYIDKKVSDSAVSITTELQKDLIDYVKSIDYASANEAGVSKVDNKYGITIVDSGADKGKLILYSATADDINNRSTYFRPITPGNLDFAVKASLLDDNGINFIDSEKEQMRNKIGIPSITDNGKYGTGTQFFDLNFGVANEILKRFFLDTLLIGNTHYGSGYIQKANNAKLFLPDIINDSTIATYLQLINRFRIDYFDLGDGASYRKSQIKLVPNSILVITENSDWQASAIGNVDNGGILSETDILPHEKTTSIGGKYYDVATTAFIVTGYENQVYPSDSKYCKVVRITIDGLHTKIKFFSVKEVDGTVLTVSMKSSGTHRECISLGALLTL